MKTYNYYLKLQEGLHKTPNADIVKALVQQSTVTNCTMWGCFAMSCMCCACCCKPGQTFLEMTDLGTNWKKALQAYEGMTPQQTRTLFLKGMNLLKEIHTHLKNYIHQQKTTQNIYATQGKVSDYNLLSLDTIILERNFESGEWIYGLINKVKNNMYSQSIHEYIEYYGIVLTSAHIRLILGCYGFFYPLLCHKYVIGINPAELTMIRQCALENCQ